MPRPKLTRGNIKDHRVTVRLDDTTYQQLKEAMERGTISNLSETLRNMIRQKLFEVRFSQELERDLQSGEVNEEDLHSVIQRVWRSLNSASERDKESAKTEGFLEGLFAAFGRFVRRSIEELDRVEAEKKRQQSNNEEQSRNCGKIGNSEPNKLGSA